jgi:hypothetical protein
MHLRKIPTVLTVLTIAAAFGLGETQAQAQLFGNPYRVKIKARGYYPGAVVVNPYATTTYVQAAPVVVSQTRIIRSAPVVQRRIIQPAPVIETRLVQPAPVIERRIIQPPAVVQSEVIQSAPVIERESIYSPYPF